LPLRGAEGGVEWVGEEPDQDQCMLWAYGTILKHVLAEKGPHVAWPDIPDCEGAQVTGPLAHTVQSSYNR
jgi:hypothetical protein